MTGLTASRTQAGKPGIFTDGTGRGFHFGSPVRPGAAAVPGTNHAINRMSPAEGFSPRCDTKKAATLKG